MTKKTLQLEAFGITDIGIVREHNEDMWAAYLEDGLFIIADGMGGHSAGEVAANEAVEHLYVLFKKWNPSPRTPMDEAKIFFQEAFAKVNSWIYQEGERHEELAGMGTTLCSLFFHQQSVILTHVGDSRIYRLRNMQLQQLTEDHSLLSELLALGAMNPADAATFSYKHILTRAIGTHPKVEPTVNNIPIEPHDCFMLCTDGLTNYTTHAQLEGILQTDASLAHKGQALVDLALKQGGGDNVTLILVDTL